jgi:hypothetical protein
VGDLGQFLGAAAGQAQDFDRGPRPERVVFFEAEVASLAGARVVCPDPRGGSLGEGTLGEDGAGQGLPGGGEGFAGPGLAGGGEQRFSGRAPFAGGAHQDRQDGQPFAGARVHPGLAVPLELALADLLPADRAGNGPAGPPGRVAGSPLRQVEVEGPDRDQALAVVDPRDVDHGLLAGARGDGLRPGAQPLFPGGCHPGGKIQAGDARVVALQVLPEAPAQEVGEVLQAGVVQRGLTLSQVVDQQVTDRAAPERVAVDELVGGELARSAEFPQPGWRLVAEDSHLVQQPVEHRGVARRPGAGPGLCVQQFQDIAGRDRPDSAALGRDDQRRAVHGLPPGRRGDAGLVVAQRLQLPEPFPVTGPGQAADQGAVTPGISGYQPAQ